MKNLLQLMSALALVVGFTACSSTSPMRFSRYAGEATIWRTMPGALAETHYAIPVYTSWPERAYDVVGSVRFQDPRRYWDDAIIGMAAESGKKNGGDAIIFHRGTAGPGSWLDTFISRPTGYGEEQTATVIKWTPTSVVLARQVEEDAFWRDFNAKFPKLAENDQLVQLAKRHLIDTGTPQNSPAMQNRLSKILSEVRSQQTAGLDGKWLLKGVAQTANLTSTGSPEEFFGVATVAVSGNKITLISTEGRIEVSFSGTVEGGQLSGMLGLGGKGSSLSVKCDGVALGQKISMAFQKLTDAGTVQGNLTLQR